MPNDLNADPGSTIAFWYYDKVPTPDPTSHQWKLAGYGTVSADGRSLDSRCQNVGMPRFCYAYPTDVNGTNTQTAPNDTVSRDGDPVDVTSGVFALQKTDLVLPGVLPVHITRTYRSKSQGIGPFGEGGSFNYHHLSLCSWVVRCASRCRIKAGYLFSQDPDGKYRNTSYPFLKGAAITRLGTTDELRWRDGTVSVFNSAGWLIAQRDRYNNTIQILRDGSNSDHRAIRNPANQALTFTYTTVRRGHNYFQVICVHYRSHRPDRALRLPCLSQRRVGLGHGPGGPGHPL